MATIKHTSSKNSDLSAAEHYLTFQHNEYTGLTFGRVWPAQTPRELSFGHAGMWGKHLRHGLPASESKVRQEWQPQRRKNTPLYH